MVDGSSRNWSFQLLDAIHAVDCLWAFESKHWTDESVSRFFFSLGRNHHDLLPSQNLSWSMLDILVRLLLMIFCWFHSSRLFTQIVVEATRQIKCAGSVKCFALEEPLSTSSKHRLLLARGTAAVISCLWGWRESESWWLVFWFQDDCWTWNNVPTNLDIFHSLLMLAWLHFRRPPWTSLKTAKCRKMLPATGRPRCEFDTAGFSGDGSPGWFWLGMVYHTWDFDRWIHRCMLGSYWSSVTPSRLGVLSLWSYGFSMILTTGERVTAQWIRVRRWEKSWDESFQKWFGCGLHSLLTLPTLLYLVGATTKNNYWNWNCWESTLTSACSEEQWAKPFR